MSPRTTRRVLLALGVVAAISGALECQPARTSSESALASHRPPLPERLPRPVKGPWPSVPAARAVGASPRWIWPSVEAFEDATRNAVGARAVQVMTAGIHVNDGPLLDDVIMVLRPSATAVEGWILVARGHDRELSGLSFKRTWEVTSGDLVHPNDRLALSNASGGYRLRFNHPRLTPDRRLHPTALADWTYVAALLDQGPPLYTEGSTFTGPAERVPRQTAIDEALARGDRRGALSLYQSYRPQGACSMDGTPNATARAYADLCYELGELGCFLQLQVRIMGDRFDRTAYASWGEAAHATEAAKLDDTGVDVERFFRGLTLQFDGVTRRGEFDTARLARSIRESGRAATVLPALATMAADRDLDEYNRWRAAAAVIRATEDDDALDEDDLAPVARAWLAERRRRKESAR